MSKLGLAAGRPSEARKKQAMAAVVDDARMVRINFDVTEDERVRLKMYAAQSRRTVSDILRELVQKHVPSS
jgi:hypothetical protein